MSNFAEVYRQDIAPLAEGLEFRPIPNEVYQPDSRARTAVPAHIGHIALPGAIVVVHLVDASRIEASGSPHPYAVVDPRTDPPGYFLRADIIPPIESSDLDSDLNPMYLRLMRYAAIYTNLSQKRMEAIDTAQ